ncbi:MAG: nucleotidyltransferase domain-containing protein [Geobacteraceae bacterium]|nr:nucleotidyltransferase domain-containing protein [Geobacteraceae bacterium]
MKATTQSDDKSLAAVDAVSGTIRQLSDVLGRFVGLELAILVGSRATGTATPDSDWDLAIQWDRGMDFMEQLAATEQLRRTLAAKLGVSEQAVDLIDLPTARLAMRAVVAEEGIPLKGAGNLAWHHFLQRTWRELEEQYWEKTYAA